MRHCVVTLLVFSFMFLPLAVAGIGDPDAEVAPVPWPVLVPISPDSVEHSYMHHDPISREPKVGGMLVPASCALIVRGRVLSARLECLEWRNATWGPPGMSHRIGAKTIDIEVMHSYYGLAPDMLTIRLLKCPVPGCIDYATTSKWIRTVRSVEPGAELFLNIHDNGVGTRFVGRNAMTGVTDKALAGFEREYGSTDYRDLFAERCGRSDLVAEGLVLEKTYNRIVINPQHVIQGPDVDGPLEFNADPSTRNAVWARLQAGAPVRFCCVLVDGAYRLTDDDRSLARIVSPGGRE
jgi:hypothetical protein